MDRSDFVRHAATEIVRVWRDGGTARTALPHPETGELMVRVIDQRDAAELIAGYLDCRIAEIQRQVFEGEPLAREEKRVLKMYPESVPLSYAWIASPDGRHWIRPLSALHMYIADEWLELAAHPATYPVAWHVPTPKSQAGDPGFTSVTISIIGDPLTVWTRLKHLNDDKWDERRRRGVPAPPPIDDQLTFQRLFSAHMHRRRRFH